MTLAQDYQRYGLSPSEDDALHNLNNMMDDDDLDGDSKEGVFGLHDDDSLDSKPRLGKKGANRKGPEMADRRAVHNAVERARRETLNGRFMTLAEALPAMAKVKRPSKSAIVNKALDFVFEAQVKEHALIKENNELRLQVDQLRARLGMAPLPPPAPLTSSTSTPTNNLNMTASATTGLAHAPSHLTTEAMPLATSASHDGGSSHSPPALVGGGSPTSSSFASPTSSLVHDLHALAPSPALGFPILAQASGPQTQPSPTSSYSGTDDFTAGGASTAYPYMMASHDSALAMGHGAQFGLPGLLSQQHGMLLAAQMQQQRQHLQSYDVYGLGAQGPQMTLVGGWGGAYGGQGAGEGYHAFA